MVGRSGKDKPHRGILGSSFSLRLDYIELYITVTEERSKTPSKHQARRRPDMEVESETSRAVALYLYHLVLPTKAFYRRTCW